MSDAHLRRADLRWSKLNEADLCSALLSEASLEDAVLSGARVCITTRLPEGWNLSDVR